MVSYGQLPGTAAGVYFPISVVHSAVLLVQYYSELDRRLQLAQHIILPHFMVMIALTLTQRTRAATTAPFVFSLASLRGIAVKVFNHHVEDALEQRGLNPKDRRRQTYNV